MKNKKIKVLSVFLLLSAIGLAGCNNPNTSDSQGSNSTSTSGPASVSTSTSTSTSISIVEKVTATFKNYDGEILWSTEIEKGASVEYKGPTPTRESTDPRIKEYKFTGWDKELTNISEDTVFTAQYSEVVNEYSVTFKNYDGTILFEDTVTHGEDATYTFDGCKKLANVELAANTKLKEIGIRAFANCTALNSFDLPDTVERVDNSAFNGCTSLASFNISATSGLKNIGRNTFEGCSSLKTIVIPATTETVMSNAFLNCSQLTIYCNFDSKPDSWSDGNWNPSACPTYWEGQWSYVDGVPTPNN